MRLAQLSPFVLAAALLLPPAVQAQTATQANASQSREERVEQRIADMHATLHITPAQDALWNSFAQVMLDNAQAMDSLLKMEPDPAGRSAEQILDSYAAITAQHAENVKKLSAAFHTLYAQLSAEQKTAADEMFRATAARHAAK